jgi:hypothetical protein
VAKKRSIFVRTLVLAAVPAACLASLLLWIGFNNNNQGEFFDPQSGAVEWSYAVLVFLAYFALVFIPIALGAVLHSLYDKTRKAKP